MERARRLLRAAAAAGAAGFLLAGCVTLTVPTARTDVRLAAADRNERVSIEDRLLETPAGDYHLTVVRLVAPHAGVFSHTRPRPDATAAAGDPRSAGTARTAAAGPTDAPGFAPTDRMYIESCCENRRKHSTWREIRRVDPPPWSYSWRHMTLVTVLQHDSIYIPADPRATLGIVTSSNPWRRVGLAREPVGVLAAGGVLIGTPHPTYWALRFAAGEQPELLAQSELFSGADGTAGANAITIVGGFFPLVRDGRAVAGLYPAGTERAARVAVGWRPLADGPIEVIAVAVSGDRWPRGAGITTAEMAQVMERLGAVEALNMDGGNSAWLQLVERERGGRWRAVGAALPRRPWLRRRGPWMALFAVDS